MKHCLALLCVLVIGLSFAVAGETPTPTKPAAKETVIAIDGLDCPSCAKKIITRITKVAGVAKAVADTDASKLSVVPQDKVVPSPREMWEAIELAGFTPLRLDGPSGSFTKKPTK